MYIYSANAGKTKSELKNTSGSGNCPDKKEQEKQNYVLRRFISYNQPSILTF